jgi:outer membrane protein
VGSGTRSDVLRAQLEVTNSRQALLQAQNQKRNAMFSLGRLVGVDGPVDARRTAAGVDELPLTREQLLELVLAAVAGRRHGAGQRAAAAAAVRAARAQYLPTLNTSGSYNWANDDPSFSDVRGSWNMRLGLSFPVFNRFQREESVERAQVQASIARLQLEDTRRLARANLERVLGTSRRHAQQIELAQEALEVAEEDLRMQQERYRLGVSTILDQVTSQENVVARRPTSSRRATTISLPGRARIADREGPVTAHRSWRTPRRASPATSTPSSASRACARITSSVSRRCAHCAVSTCSSSAATTSRSWDRRAPASRRS